MAGGTVPAPDKALDKNNLLGQYRDSIPYIIHDNHKMERNMRTLAFALALAILAAPSVARAENSNLLFILDASNSMWGQVDGKAKIETAKSAFETLTSDIPDNVDVALAAYGHSDKDSCDNIEFLTPFVAKADRGQLTEAVGKVKPTGKTPIAAALEKLGGDVAAKHKGRKNSIVLISDGLESCDGDPCAVAEKLAAANMGFQIHVVGFDIAEKDRKQLECIAEKGKGKYFAANSTEGFSEAIGEAVKSSVEAPPPAKPAATYAEIFRDNFEGSDLAAHWEIKNPDPNAFIVEDGNLILVAGKVSGLADPNLKNLLTLSQEMPKNGWKMTARVTMPVKTKFERFTIGVYDTETQWISASVAMVKEYPETLALIVEKRSGDDKAVFDKYVFGHPINKVESLAKYDELAPFDLQLIKEGREVWATLTSSQNPEITFTTEKLSTLRAVGKPVVALHQGGYDWQVKGESQANVDWVKIEGQQE